ncbi:PREDICTED: dynactin-associated protein [Chinchilla lanigera]|uniref:Dynactin-associated protein n=1 Tax=Chinchilla lanigera TaxID=34839 RepID=A0A8C2V578_CHILA|nr:dynactin-associated protein [Chinchilla lanigera]XP_005373008.1 PREDICTED: dynactin-associated protein [Chinchilla lanigera]
MTSKPEEYVMEIEQNAAETFPRNPYCLSEGTQCGCRLHNVIIQPQMASGKPWSLWKTCLVCLLACLIASAIVALVSHFGQYGKPIGNTTIIIHADGRSNQGAGIPTYTPPTSSTSPGPQSTTPSTPTTSPSTSTSVPTTSMETTTTISTTTPIHHVDIEYEDEE